MNYKYTREVELHQNAMHKSLFTFSPHLCRLTFIKIEKTNQLVFLVKRFDVSMYYYIKVCLIGFKLGSKFYSPKKIIRQFELGSLLRFIKIFLK